MTPLISLLQNNKRWAARIEDESPGFFRGLQHQQTPSYLWIGCSDSRVPANEIVDLAPGELFVHRNVANVVVHSDLNCLSVVQYAVDVLKVRHIIVCGHYGCGGIIAAHRNAQLGLISNWLRHVQDVALKHHLELAQLETEEKILNRLAELNVSEQVLNVCQTTVVQAAWDRGQTLTVHGWIYGLHDGILHDLTQSFSKQSEVDTFRINVGALGNFGL